MDFDTYDFRNAIAILSTRREWPELTSEINAISRQEIIDAQRDLAAKKKRPPAGAQAALNEVFRRRLDPLGWIGEGLLFDPSAAGTSDSRKRDLAKWAMDFVKRGPASAESAAMDFGVGIEVAFNHAEAIAWTLVRLNIAGESPEVIAPSKIDVGIAIFAQQSLKRWGRMDGSVGTYQQALLWLERMKPVLPIPIALIGLKADWEPTDVFRGTLRNK